MSTGPTAVKTMGIGRSCLTHMNFTVTMADADKRKEDEKRARMKVARRRLKSAQDGGNRL